MEYWATADLISDGQDSHNPNGLMYVQIWCQHFQIVFFFWSRNQIRSTRATITYIFYSKSLLKHAKSKIVCLKKTKKTI